MTLIALLRRDLESESPRGARLGRKMYYYGPSYYPAWDRWEVQPLNDIWDNL